MKVLVTGSRGFIGRGVVDEARRRGHDVHVLSHDLRNPTGLSDHLQGIDAVIHCAAAMSGHLDAQRSVTVNGTQHLLSAMTTAGVKHIVGISTMALYDYHRLHEGAVLDEESPLTEDFDQLGPYVRAKREQEDLLRAYAVAHGWRWTILRPGIVFGPGRTWSYHMGIQLSPTVWVCLSGSALLPLTYVENCAEAIVLALEVPGAHRQTLNIVDDDLPDRQKYARELCRPEQARLLVVPWKLLRGAARLADRVNRTFAGKIGLPGLLNPVSLDARCKPLRYANHRVKATLGWTPRWSVAQGLDRTFAGF